MKTRELIPDDSVVAQKLNPELPNYVSTEAAFIAAVEVGLAEIDAGQTVPFDIVAADLRRAPRGMP